MVTQRPNNSGHHAIAGFFYQLLATSADLCELLNGPRDDDDPNEVLVLERFGQDSAVCVSNDETCGRLIQYKYSRNESELRPSDLREILQSFNESIGALHQGPDQVEYRLVTNRPFSPDAEKWNAARTASDAEALQNLIRKSCQSEVECVEALANIFNRLEYVRQTQDDLEQSVEDVARAFGMRDCEIDAGIDQLIGWLLGKASKQGRRIVRREEFHTQLVGCNAPYKLLSPDSVGLRRKSVAEYISPRCVTIRREVAEEIARAALDYPVTVVIGDGGMGKSVAACDAIQIGLQSLDDPPGFGLVLPAIEATPDSLVKEIARWRNVHESIDGKDHEKAIERLRGVFAGNPLLTLCIDAIDEKSGKAKLPRESQAFIRKLIQSAIDDYERLGTPVTSVVLTCRKKAELDNLVSDGHGSPWNAHIVEVVDFNDDEMARLIDVYDIDDSIKKRLLTRIRSSLMDVASVAPRDSRPISAPFLELIRQPEMWRIFSALPAPRQHECLDDDQHARDELFDKYMTWFCQKTEERVRDLRQLECRIALFAVARKFRQDSAKVANLRDDWITPCTDDGCDRTSATRIFEECVTAGIVVEEEKCGKRWRWRHPWFCEFLIRHEENNR